MTCKKIEIPQNSVILKVNYHAVILEIRNLTDKSVIINFYPVSIRQKAHEIFNIEQILDYDKEIRHDFSEVYFINDSSNDNETNDDSSDFSKSTTSQPKGKKGTKETNFTVPRSPSQTKREIDFYQQCKTPIPNLIDTPTFIRRKFKNKFRKDYNMT